MGDLAITVSRSAHHRPLVPCAAGVLLLSVPLLAGGADALTCQGADAARLTAAVERLNQADDEGAARTLGEARATETACPELMVARLAVGAWIEARRLALVGGDPAALGGVRGILDQLGGLAGGRRGTVEGQRTAYAEAVVRAAVAAAQDERDEMHLFLVHARDLADRLRLGGERARWPLGIDEAEGELWLEVDRYAEAREAFRRAPVNGRTLVGLAHATERVGAPTEACLAWRRAAGQALAEAARRRVVDSLARLRCAPDA